MPQISERHMREYETLYILKPEIEDEVAVKFINKMKDLVAREGGEHLQVTNWGRKKLAWERDRNQKGMFVNHRYLGKPGLVKEYERALGIDENCLLRQTIVLSKTIEPGSKQAEADTIEPPVTKEARREERDEERSARRERDERSDFGEADRLSEEEE